MKEIIISKKYDGKKLKSVLLNEFSGLSFNTLNKALREKDIKINNIRTNKNVSVNEGDIITIYITDDKLVKNSNLLIKECIVYEDDNIIIINKPSGICIKSDTENESSLEEILQTYSNGKFDVLPCHRIDRNTKGLVLFAKNPIALNEILYGFKNHNITKKYRCLVLGIPKEKSKLLKAYLFKDSQKNIVIISNVKKNGYIPIETMYTIEKTNNNNTCWLNIQLITGKTHQIRAHLAFIGHPIIGDNKYGNKKTNKEFGMKFQELTAYSIKFENDCFKNLKYLNNMEFKIKENNNETK